MPLCSLRYDASPIRVLASFFLAFLIDGMPDRCHIEIGECSNFRDLGGYVTADGKHRTRWNRLYRSDHLAKIPHDEKHIKFLTGDLNVDCAIDFRGEIERMKENYRFPGVEYVVISIEPGDVLRMLTSQVEVTVEAAEKSMIHLNELLVGTYQKDYATFMQVLLDKAPGGKAVVFHCTAGKDRTGFAAALILLLLDIPVETVLEDYLLTNRFFKPPAEHQVLALFPNMRVEKGAIDRLFYVRASYLETALRSINERYGGIRQYAQSQLSLTDAQVDLLREHYLEEISTDDCISKSTQ